MQPMGFINIQQNLIPTANVPLDEFKHALFLGKTGFGKTSGGINPVIDSRLKAGYGMLIFDEKGKEHRVAKLLAHKHDRLCDVLEIGKAHGIYINLLYEMSDREVERLCRNFLKRSHEAFWTEGAVSMFMDLVKWLNQIKDFYRLSVDAFGLDHYSMLLKEKKEGKNETEMVVHEISSQPLTLKELSSYFQSTEAFIMVSQAGNRYITLISESIKSSLIGMSEITSELDAALAKADVMMEKLTELTTALKANKIKNDSSEASGKNGNYFMLSSTIGMLGDNEYINAPLGEDIKAMLEEGKVIVVNTEAFGNAALGALLDKTLESLSHRAKLPNAHPICVVIDEANRVLDSDSDIHTDILRESKVEIIMATQNHYQMQLKMGAAQWESFAENFNTRYSFQGKSPTNPHALVIEEEITENRFEIEPMFFQEEDLYHIELAYQHSHSFYDDYLNNSDEIVLYDHRLYENKQQIMIMDTRTTAVRYASVEKKIAKPTPNSFRNYANTLVSLKKNTRIVAG